MAQQAFFPPAEDPAATTAVQRPLPYRGLRWTFAVMLLLSLGLLLLGLGVAQRFDRNPLVSPDPSEATGKLDLVLVVSTATSVASLLGLLSTTLLAWRREAREARSAVLELRQKELEIESLKLQLEKQRREAQSTPPDP